MYCSVCIPTAGEESTKNAVASVLNQKTCFPFEVIVSGNVPDDLPVSPYLSITHTGPVPPGHARNEAVFHAKGDILVFLDADCIAQQNWLQAISDRIASGSDLVGGAVEFPSTAYFPLADNIACFFDQTPFLAPGHVKTIAALNMACTKSAFEKTGPFHPRIQAGEDLEWILRARRLQFTPFFEPKARCIHTGGRKTFSSMIHHARTWGRHSIHIRKEYQDVLYTPSIFFNALALSLLSPFIGGAFAVQILFSPGMLRHAHTWPAIAAAKTAWCLAAASSLK